MVQDKKEVIEYILLNYYPDYEGNIRRRSDYKQWKKDSIVGTVGKRGYATLSILGKRYYCHHIVWVLFYKQFPVMLDHINGVKTDNRINNLRETSKTNNALNLHGPHRDNSSGFLGVYKRKDNGKYTAKFKGKFLGDFNTPEEAYEKYKNIKFG